MRLAILIVGEQNSGKTSTIKHLINTYGFKTLSVMRAGWNQIFLNSVFKSLRLHFYCIPASPTETGIDLSERFSSWHNLPEVLVVAEQLHGSKLSSTLSFLAANGYHVERFDINNVKGVSNWERYDLTTEKMKLDNRANDIIQQIKSFIISRRII